MEEDIDCFLVAEGVTGDAREQFELSDIVVYLGVFHFKFGQVVSGSLLMLAIGKLVEELGLKGLPNIRYVLGDRVQCVDPGSYCSGPFGDFGSVHERECQGHFTNW